MHYNRRTFLKLSALASASAMVPGFLKGSGLGDSLDFKGKRLIVIQLSGGNDGLNTLIPFRNDDYYSLRPKLGIAAEEVLKLDDALGFNPVMAGMRELWDQGDLTIINRVGYPNPDRSHFRSMDIWHSGSNSNEYWETGWLGRYLDAQCEGCVKPHGIIETNETLSLAVKGSNGSGLAVRDLQKLYNATRDSHLQSLAAEISAENADLGFLYSTLTQTIESVGYIHDQASKYKAQSEFPRNTFGKSLKMIAEMIVSGIETPVYYASLGGFDTHVYQRIKHDNLLKNLSNGLKALTDELKASDNWNNTRIMVFSEFGRRVEQNASAGTDHGKANVFFLLGGNLKKPGMYNSIPNLSDLDDGDLKFEIDFRRIYAEILNNWMEVDAEKILKRRFDPLGIVRG